MSNGKSARLLRLPRADTQHQSEKEGGASAHRELNRIRVFHLVYAILERLRWT